MLQCKTNNAKKTKLKKENNMYQKSNTRTNILHYDTIQYITK